MRRPFKTKRKTRETEVYCAICDKRLHKMTWRHLKIKHGLTAEQYATMYRDALFAKSEWRFRSRVSQKIHDQNASRKQRIAIQDRERQSRMTGARRLFKRKILPNI